jgi:hypothetical protein
MVNRADRDHSVGVVVMFDMPLWIEVVILEIRDGTAGHRAAETHFPS